MIYLRDMPSDKTLDNLAERYDSLDPLSVKACFYLLRSSSDLMQAFEGFLGKYDLTQGNFFLLTVINRQPDKTFTPTELAEILGVSRATMTGLLDGLERKGLIDRSIHAADRRKMSVKLTEKGLTVLDEILPDYYRQIEALMGCLSSEERGDLLALLARVSRRLSEIGEKSE